MATTETTPSAPSIDIDSALGKKRYRQTVRMVARFGVQIWLLNKGRFFRSKKAQAQRKSELYRRQAQEFCETATRLGGLIIKLGQHLSTHIEFMPKEYLEELSKLQDAVPPVPTEQIIAAIEQEFEAPLAKTYAEFASEPIAAASLSQVHKAKLTTGETVAVKVLRPGIENLIAIDLESLRAVLRMAARFTSIRNFIDIDRFYAEFKTTISQELDLNRERASADAVRTSFAGNSHVRVPKTYWAHTTTRVLTLEYMEGVKISDLGALDAMRIDRRQLARTLIDMYLRMILRDGFFHADPHPGNVLVDKDGNIVLLDFGMMGHVSHEMREQFTGLATAIFMKDTAEVTRSFQELGFLRTNIDTTAFEKSLKVFLDRLVSGGSSPMSAGMASGMAAGGARFSEDTLDELSEFMRSQPFQLPDNVTFLFKAVSTVTGLCFELDPGIDLVEEVREAAPEFLEAGVGGAVFSTILDQAKELLPEILPLIKRIPSVVEKMDSGDLTVKLAKVQERRIIENGQRGAQKIVRAILGAVILLAGVLLLGDSYSSVAHHETISYVMMALGALILLMQTGSGSKKRRRRAPHPTFKRR